MHESVRYIYMGADVAASDAAAFFREYSKLIRSFVSVVGLVRRSVVLDLPHAPVARLQAADLLGRQLSFLFHFKRRLKSPRTLFDEAKTLRKGDLSEVHPSLNDYCLYSLTGEIGASVIATFQMSQTQLFHTMFEQFKGLFTDPRRCRKT